MSAVVQPIPHFPCETVAIEPPPGLMLEPPPGLEEHSAAPSEEEDGGSWRYQELLMWDHTAQTAHANRCSVKQAQAWWSLYKNLGGEQGPLGTNMNDAAEPISVVSSDSSPAGSGQWWQRNSVDCKERERCGTGSTMASLSGLTDEPSIDDDDDDTEGTVILSDNSSDGGDAESEAAILENEDADGEGSADGYEVCGSASDDEREALVVASICRSLRNQLAASHC